MSIYQERGYKNRIDYLRKLSDKYGVDFQTVFEIAIALGPEEDFDALVTNIEDWIWDDDPD